MDIKNVFSNNKTWIKDKLGVDSSYFENLAKGQSPGILYIGCSDSRVNPELFMGLGPGDVFVHRNIANVVPVGDLNVMSVIEYAVKHLKVEHVVVCGHYECGGVKAAMDSSDLGILNPWLRNIRDVYRTHQEELDGISNEKDRYRRLVDLNVQEQAINVYKTEVLQAAEGRGIKVHGWVFDIATGEIVDLNLDFNALVKDIKSIYAVS